MRRARWRDLLLIVVCAALAFGGTFTCRWNDDDDDDDHWRGDDDIFHDVRNDDDDDTTSEFRQ